MNKIIRDYNHKLSKKLIAKAKEEKREQNKKFFEWLFSAELRQSRDELSRWAYEKDYK